MKLRERWKAFRSYQRLNGFSLSASWKFLGNEISPFFFFFFFRSEFTQRRKLRGSNCVILVLLLDFTRFERLLRFLSLRSIRSIFIFRNSNKEKRGSKCIKLNSSETGKIYIYISVYNIVGVSYPIISSALLPVTGRAACIGRPVVRPWYPYVTDPYLWWTDCFAESWTSFSGGEF